MISTVGFSNRAGFYFFVGNDPFYGITNPQFYNPVLSVIVTENVATNTADVDPFID